MRVEDLEKEYKTNLIKRFITSFVIIIPVMAIMLNENFWIFSTIIFLICSVGFYEWNQNMFGSNMMGLFILSVFGMSSVYFVGQELYQEISAYTFLLMIILNTAIFDSFAFIVGSLFGKNFIARTISPKKTFEGLLGGLLGSILFFLLISNYYDLGYVNLIVFILACFFAFFGDLLISYFKRKKGIKDTGSILPGHGGILDRLDSHLLATPISVLLFLLIS